MANEFELADKILKRIERPEFGDHAPVINEKLPINPIPGTEVLITQNVKKWLDEIFRTTIDANEEITFLLFGHVNGQQVVFDDGFVDRSPTSSGVSAGVTARHDEALNKFCDAAPKDSSCIVAWGHTHPRTGYWYTNFSLGDIKGLTKFRNDVNVFKTGQINLCAVLLTGGNYNFLFFDGNDYYRFDKVFVIDRFNRKIQQLPCYGPDTNSLHNANNRNR